MRIDGRAGGDAQPTDPADRDIHALDHRVLEEDVSVLQRPVCVRSMMQGLTGLERLCYAARSIKGVRIAVVCYVHYRGEEGA